MTKRVLVALVVAGVVAVAGSALTGSSTVPGTNAGQGAGVISGYAYSGAPIDYTLDADNPQQVASVSFTINAPTTAAATVRARIVASGPYDECTTTAGTGTTSTWNCSFAGVAVTSATNLNAVAAQ